jgi:cystathionine gamma-synthase
MATGYPRFFIPRVVDHLATRLLEIYESRHKSNYYGSRRNTGTRLALLLSTGNQARRCREVLSRWSPLHSDPDISIRTVRWNDRVNGVQATDRMNGVGNEDIILVSYPSELAAEAKAFWQHTGYGISSRRARHWLDHAPFLSPNLWYPKVIDDTETRHQLDLARITLKQRIAAGHSSPSDGISVTEDDVFLYQTGMTAIVETAAAVKSLLRFSVPGARSRVAVFGFVTSPRSPTPFPTNAKTYLPYSRKTASST